MKSNEKPNLFTCDALKEIAASRGTTIAQIMLSWAVNRGTIPIPKSAIPERQRQNLEAADIELSDSEMLAIKDLDHHHRFVDGKFWECENGPHTATNIWA